MINVSHIHHFTVFIHAKATKKCGKSKHDIQIKVIWANRLGLNARQSLNKRWTKGQKVKTFCDNGQLAFLGKRRDRFEKENQVMSVKKGRCHNANTKQRYSAKQENIPIR